MIKEILFVGPPGAGKGTQAARICEQFGHEHISTGSILRSAIDAGTDLGIQAKVAMDRGELVADDLVEALVREKLQSLPRDKGFLLDGYPRNIAQAQKLDAILQEVGRPLRCVIEIVVSEKALIDRLLKRAVSEGRSDDTEEVISKRMTIYQEMTMPLTSYYQDQGIHRSIDGEQEVDVVAEAIASIVSA